ncbi:MAG: AAA family ATPase [Candidatus Bipolaricaulota bacterium]|nr:MAG: AAA family ATPase [Candidatus Bipolaricaulota bacterium]
MINPFRYGGIVGEGSFCDREQELRDLHRAMENGERLFVYSERRMGKTSLVRLALERLPRDAFDAAYIDLWPTDDEASFVAATARGLSESLATAPERVLEAARAFFQRLQPSLVLDTQGRAELRFALSATQSTGPELENVLRAPARIASRRAKQLVVVFDEFQRVLDYPSDRVERSLRSAVQEDAAVSYVFLGSQKHLIRQMVLERTSPFYRAGGHFVLRPISADAWDPFIRSRFSASDRGIDSTLIERIIDLTGGHPFYTQHLCHTLWELTEPACEATEALLEDAVELLLERESFAYLALWESLAMMQRRLLAALSEQAPVEQIFASAFVQRHRLKSASAVQRAVRALLERDLIDRSNGSYVVSDRFLALWIRRRHPTRAA